METPFFIAHNRQVRLKPQTEQRSGNQNKSDTKRTFTLKGEDIMNRVTDIITGTNRNSMRMRRSRRTENTLIQSTQRNSKHDY